MSYTLKVKIDKETTPTLFAIGAYGVIFRRLDKTHIRQEKLTFQIFCDVTPKKKHHVFWDNINHESLRQISMYNGDLIVRLSEDEHNVGYIEFGFQNDSIGIFDIIDLSEKICDISKPNPVTAPVSTFINSTAIWKLYNWAVRRFGEESVDGWITLRNGTCIGLDELRVQETNFDKLRDDMDLTRLISG